MKTYRVAALFLFAGSLLLCIHAFAGEPPPGSAVERHAQLRSEIARHDDLYFRQAAPEISDAEYDALKRELRQLEEQHPSLATGRPEENRLGDDRTGRFPTQAHRVPMLGLEKTHTEAELRKFLSRAAKALGDGKQVWLVEPKFDGLAISLTYEQGRLVQAITRGNGVEGDVVTANLLACTDVPRELGGGAVPDRVELRGEVFMEQAEFERINAERHAAGREIYAHPRNLAVGTLKSLDPAELAARRLSIVFFGWGGWEPAEDEPPTQREFYGRMAAWGLATPEAHIATGPETVWGLVRAMDHGRIEFPAPLDGAVVKLDAVDARRRLGESRTAPLWAVAHKFEPERVETRLLGITLQVGRTGAVTPVAELQPVRLGGSAVSRATLHNRREIERRDYRIGDTVRVEKAGDIIPQLVGVNLALRPTGSTPYAFPEKCPACATALAPDGDAGLRCGNRRCPAQVKRRVEHFVSKSALNIRGFGPVLADSLVERGIVRDLDDLFRLTDADVPRGVREQLEQGREAELWRVIVGLGLPEIGAVNARRLAVRFGRLDALAEADEAALREAGLTAVAAREVAATLAEPEMRRLLTALTEAGLRPVVAAAPGSGLLSGRYFVFTGTLPTLTREEAERRVRAAGGRVQTGVTRQTTHVVAGESGGRKIEEARRLGVPVLTEEEFLRLLDPMATN